LDCWITGQNKSLIPVLPGLAVYFMCILLLLERVYWLLFVFLFDWV